jgi:hypothetical protein
MKGVVLRFTTSAQLTNASGKRINVAAEEAVDNGRQAHKS